ncbi:hypothetical protein PQX77_021143 [Marasmius sp. AFHP31]|nr:hypothetical protein PQX77_021143 [Marasmius sp. AFHP31]
MFQNMPQCTSCGIKWKNLQGDKCGGCRKADEDTTLMPPPPSQSMSMTPTVQNHPEITAIPNTHPLPALPPPTQANAVDHPGKAIFQSQMKAGKAAATREAEQWFAQHRQAAVSGKCMIQTYLHAYTDATKPKAITSVRSSMASWDADRPLKEAITAKIREINIEVWEPNTSGSIQEGDYFIRLPGAPPIHLLHGLPGETKSSKKPKEFKETIHIWLVFRIAKIEERDGPLPTGFLDPTAGTSKKRKAPLDIAVGDTLSSNSLAPEPNAVNWAGEDLHEGKLAFHPFANGASKLVFLLIINGKRYVAKRYTVIPDGNLPSNLEDVDKLMMLQNSRLLEQELRVQKQGAYFLKEFYSTAWMKCAVLSTEFTFTDCWLAHEMVDDSAPNPSKASGWLVEPYRAIQTTKYSGTLSECKETTLPFKTMSAFTHFTHYWSFGILVYVDLQSSHTFKNGHVSWVLFDAMTHTQKKGSSSPGDHGEDGINNFVLHHQCNAICESLELLDVSSSSKEDTQLVKTWKGHKSGSTKAGSRRQATKQHPDVEDKGSDGSDESDD